MRTLTRLAVTLCMGGASLILTPLVAEDIAPGTSYTHKIVNPGFDKNNGNGWTIVADKNVKYGYQAMEVYSSVFNVYQSVKGLPPGIYTLTVNAFHRAAKNDAGAAYNDNTEIINAVLYSQTRLKTKEVLFQSLYSVSDFSGGKMSNGYVDDMNGAEQAFTAGLYLNTLDQILVGGDSTLTIGVRTLGPNVDASWSLWDNFTLTYEGPAGPGQYAELMDDLEFSLGEYGESVLPGGTYNEVIRTLEYKRANDASDDPKVLLAVIDSLSNVWTRTQMAADAMATLTDLTDRAMEFMEADYPGKEALNAVYLESIDLMQPGAVTSEGKPVYGADVLAAVAKLEKAIKVYRFTRPMENPEEGLDVTWTLKAPAFTKEGGDPSLPADASSEGWMTANVPAVNAQYRLSTVSGKNCWNNYSTSFTSMDVYQELENMPAGLYTFSCYQTNDGGDLTDQHAYATAVGGTADSRVAEYTFAEDIGAIPPFATNAKWEGPLTTEKILVGSDGRLRVGFASTSNGNGSSGWFCITDASLTYYGMPDDAYAQTMQNQITKAEGLQNSVMLGADKKVLAEGIATAKQVDVSDPVKAQAGLEALNKVISNVDVAVKALAVFKDTLAARTDVIINNAEDLYPQEIVDLVSHAVVVVDGVLKADTTSTAAFTGLHAILDQHLSYIGAYLKYRGDAASLGDDKVTALSEAALQAQTLLVTADYQKLGEAKAMFNDLLSFSKLYLEIPAKYVENEMYPSSSRNELAQARTEQFAVVEAEHSKVREAQRKLCALIAGMVFDGVEPGEESDVTSVTIVNPTVEVPSEDKTVAPEGWAVVNNGVNTTNTGQHWDGTANRYFDTYLSADKGKLNCNLTQDIKGIPNGIYKLVAAARTAGEGAYLFVRSGNTVHYTEIPNEDTMGGNIWEAAEDGSDVKLAHGALGWGWNWVEVANVDVTENAITIGITTDQKLIGVPKAFSGTWYSADDFKLYWISNSRDAVEEVDASSGNLIVSSQNGYIVVEGVEEYTITDLNGVSVKADTQIVPGVYIVKSGIQSVKVVVE